LDAKELFSFSYLLNRYDSLKNREPSQTNVSLQTFTLFISQSVV